MTEIRKDPITGREVIVAVERGQRPSDFRIEDEGLEDVEYLKSCPFCIGNEYDTPKEKDRFTNREGWSVRVIPNLYSALTLDSNIISSNDKIFSSENGIGIHEVIVESPKHNKNIFNMSVDEIRDILRMFKVRHNEAINDENINYVSIFKNYKSRSGASLEHPHSQIIASSIIPSFIKEELNNTLKYHDENHNCIYCHILDREISLLERVIINNDKFVVFAPYASRYKYETVIFPKEHSYCFGEINDEEIYELAKVLKDLYNRKKKVLGDFPFNLYIHTTPKDSSKYRDSYHWHIHITPRLSIPAGYELGTDIYINTIAPEKVAKSLR